MLQLSTKKMTHSVVTDPDQFPHRQKLAKSLHKIGKQTLILLSRKKQLPLSVTIWLSKYSQYLQNTLQTMLLIILQKRSEKHYEDYLHVGSVLTYKNHMTQGGLYWPTKTIWHTKSPILLDKHNYYGVKGIANDWLKSFLKQFTTKNAVSSRNLSISHWVL